MKTSDKRGIRRYRSYSETKNKKRFDWQAMLQKPCDELTVYEVKSMNSRAKSYITDAAGNQASIIPRHSDGRVIDNEMFELNNHFNSQIDAMTRNLLTVNYVPISESEKTDLIKMANNSRIEALKTLNKIEKHSIKLIKSVVTSQKMLKRT